jgi:predicted dehydrogenase
VGICDVVPQVINGVPFFSGYHELLSAVHPDIVLITTPNFLHKEICLSALAAGCHVIKEKPLAISFAEGQEIYASAQKAGKIVSTLQQRYYSPLFLEAKRLLPSIGQLQRFSYLFTLDDTQQSWYWELSQSGGGSWLNIGWHGIATLEWLLGSVTAVSLRAKSGGMRPWTYNTDHSSLAKLTIQDSIPGTAFFSCVYPKEELLRVIGSHGELQLSRKKLKLFTPTLKLESQIEADESSIYQTQLRTVLSQLTDGSYSMEKDLHILKVIDAGTQCYQQGVTHVITL